MRRPRNLNVKLLETHSLTTYMFFSFVAVLVLAAAARADLIAYESFSYL